MRIALCCTDTKAEPWLAGLRAALPQATVENWTPGASQADYAVVWAPPQAFVNQQVGLKAVFNIGAGVDALMALQIPAAMKVLRLDDAGMSVQMAEYVCHAVIRHFREFDGYEADVKLGKWSYRKPRSRADFPVGVMGMGVLGQRVAQAVAQFDFPVLGWSRTDRQVAGIRCYSAADGFEAFLAATRVLVCLLPLTPETRDIIMNEYLVEVVKGSDGKLHQKLLGKIDNVKDPCKEQKIGPCAPKS